MTKQEAITQLVNEYKKLLKEEKKTVDIEKKRKKQMTIFRMKFYKLAAKFDKATLTEIWETHLEKLSAEYHKQSENAFDRASGGGCRWKNLVRNDKFYFLSHAKDAPEGTRAKPGKKFTRRRPEQGEAEMNRPIEFVRPADKEQYTYAMGAVIAEIKRSLDLSVDDLDEIIYEARQQQGML